MHINVIPTTTKTLEELMYRAQALDVVSI